MSSRVAAIVVMMAALTLACGGCEKPVHPLSRLVAQPGTVAELGYGIQWQIGLGLPEKHRLIYAELLGDRLVTLETGNILSVIRTDTGQVMWRAPMGAEIEQFAKPLRNDGLLIITSSSRAHIYEIETGDLVRIFDLSYVSNTTPIVFENTMIHGSPSGVVFAQDINLGLSRWNYQTGTGITTNPVLAGPTLVVANDAGNVVAFSPATGGLLWRTDTFGRISAQPIATERLVFVASEDQSLYAFIRNNGRQAWRYYSTGPLTKEPFLVPGMLLQRVPVDGLVALDENTGELIWKRTDLYDSRPLMVTAEGLYVHHRGQLLVLSPTDGDTLEQVNIPAVHSVVADQGGGNLYLIRLNGRIMKITPR